jgi:hypothetical protein
MWAFSGFSDAAILAFSEKYQLIVVTPYTPNTQSIV